MIPVANGLVGARSSAGVLELADCALRGVGWSVRPGWTRIYNTLSVVDEPSRFTGVSPLASESTSRGPGIARKNGPG